MGTERITVRLSRQGVERVITCVNADQKREVDLAGVDLSEIPVGWGKGRYGVEYWDFAASKGHVPRIAVCKQDIVRNVQLTRTEVSRKDLRTFKRIRDTTGREWKLIEGPPPKSTETVLLGRISVAKEGLRFHEEGDNGTIVRTFEQRIPLPGSKPLERPSQSEGGWSQDIRIEGTWRGKSHTIRVIEKPDGTTVDGGGMELGIFSVFPHYSTDPVPWSLGLSSGPTMWICPGIRVDNMVLRREKVEHRGLAFYKRIEQHSELSFGDQWQLIEGRFPSRKEVLLGGSVTTPQGREREFIEFAQDGSVRRRWRTADRRARIDAIE
jgi:hypothetical protein